MTGNSTEDWVENELVNRGRIYHNAQETLTYYRGRLRASILGAHERGIKPPRIAELVGLSRQSVHDILKKGER